jgi:hypothetical protein
VRAIAVAACALALAVAPAAVASSDLPSSSPALSQANREALAELAKLNAEIKSRDEAVNRLQARLRQLSGEGASSQTVAPLEAELSAEQTELEVACQADQNLIQNITEVIQNITQLDEQVVQGLGQTAQSEDRRVGRRQGRPPRTVAVLVRGHDLRRLTTYLDGSLLASRLGNRIRVWFPWRSQPPGAHHVHTVAVTTSGRVRYADVWLLRHDDRVDAIVRRVLGS